MDHTTRFPRLIGIYMRVEVVAALLLLNWPYWLAGVITLAIANYITEYDYYKVITFKKKAIVLLRGCLINTAILCFGSMINFPPIYPFESKTLSIDWGRIEAHLVTMAYFLCCTLFLRLLFLVVEHIAFRGKIQKAYPLSTAEGDN